MFKEPLIHRINNHPLTEKRARNPGDKGRAAHKAENLTAVCEPIVQKMWEPRRLTILRACMTCYRDRFTLLLNIFLFLSYSLPQLE
jgi:hypothetical protein